MDEQARQEMMRRRDLCLAVLRSQRKHQADLVEEYIAEAEHADGPGHWSDLFYKDDTVLSIELRADFDEFVGHVLEAEVEAVEMQEFDRPAPDKVAGLIEALAQSMVEALDADFERMDDIVWERLANDPELAPYGKAWAAAVEAEANGTMTACAFDLFQDWFSDAVRAPMLDQIALEVLTRAIQITALGATAELRYHYVPIRNWQEFVVDEDDA